MSNSKISALTSATTPVAGTEVLPIVQSSATKQVSIANLTAARAVSASSYAVTGSAAPANGFYLPAANAVGIAASSAEQVRVTSGALQMRSGTALYVYNATNDGLGLWYNPGGAGVNQLVGRVNGADRLTIDGTAGDVTVGQGNLVIGTSGKGIDFSATPGTGTSELFADYEEGTFTPTPVSTVGSITSTGTLTGRYTKIGRLVTVQITIEIINNGTGAGALYISSLPFASATNSGGSGISRVTFGMLQVNVDAGSTTPFLMTPVYSYPGGNNTELRCTLSYEV
jgi:hypothetical protein